MFRFLVIGPLVFLLLGCTNIEKSGTATSANNNDSTVSTKAPRQSQQKGNKQHTNDAKKPLTMEQLKKKVKDNILEVTKYESSYALVKSENSYQFFDLMTGTSKSLPVNVDNIKSYQIKDKDHIRFLADGTNRLNSKRVLPYYFDCIRVTTDGPFARHDVKTYFPLNNALEFGGKPDEVVSDIRFTMNGLQILFTPQKSKEAMFYADYTTIPVTTTSYNEMTNTFVVEFKQTQLSKEINKVNVRPNDFIKRINTKTEGENVQISIELKSAAEVYSGNVGHLKNKNNFPFLTFTFAQKSFKEVFGGAVAELSK
ncbi:AMIN domain-containing protein [Pontibacillus sp. HMF3514]|uniref:AMIN domain-containing protein n=1 Tax=Pontibacillus sp. HMF3514 TaxID=2692425 RepID=UPI00132019AE|nr:AMIN domain-containing protein [Pontibacillus sp. HMF3514]QHE52828.1 hypothetical protein GS400_12705 [Pontibacillus sp. HMF3514]